MIDPEALSDEAMTTWRPEEALRRIDTRWTPALLTRFAAVVREAVSRAPEDARRAGLITTARTLLRGNEAGRLALGRDPALGRWTAGAEAALIRGEALDPWFALAPRLALALALRTGESLETKVILGSGGRARIPCDGRVLQGPPARGLRVKVQAGALMTHAKAVRRAGAFEVIDGDGEGGALPVVQPLSGGSTTEIVQPLSEGVACLEASDPELAREIATLSPALVAVAGAVDVSHSASLSEARGCIWLTPVKRPLVVAETLVHEASHLKFFLVEDLAPLVTTPDVPRFEVPWRADKRPLRAVLMGLHAWVRVLEWLKSFEGGPHAQAAGERSIVLGEATRAAREILREAEGLTEGGQALLRTLSERVPAR